MQLWACNRFHPKASTCVLFQGLLPAYMCMLARSFHPMASEFIFCCCYCKHQRCCGGKAWQQGKAEKKTLNAHGVSYNTWSKQSKWIILNWCRQLLVATHVYVLLWDCLLFLPQSTTNACKILHPPFD